MDDTTKIWLATDIKMLPVKDLKPRERNPRRHSPDKLRALADAIARCGWTVPVVVEPGGVLLAGHARLEAAKLLGLDRVPAIEAGHLTPAQRRAYVIADNRMAELSDWDDAMLLEELRALQGEPGGLELVGFSDDDLAALEADMRQMPAGGQAMDMGEAPSGAPPGYGDPANEQHAGAAEQSSPAANYALAFADDRERVTFVQFLGFLRAQKLPGSSDTSRLVNHCRLVMEAAAA